MALQNRVTPEGEIVAVDARGLMMGNRGGALHDAERRLGRRRWVSRQWICCLIAFKERRRAVMAPGRYTELFFLDEATALAAGHRPCFECRRQDAVRFAELWSLVSGGGEARASAQAMDAVLHPGRVDRQGRKVIHDVLLRELPDGAMVRHQGEPHLVWGDTLRRWTPSGYTAPVARPRGGTVEVLTPAAIVKVLAAGFRPVLHPTAMY